MIRIIDNKKIDLTDDEWNMYQNICKSYTTSSFNGSDLFIDLFETNPDGIIVFLKPPQNRRVTMEIIYFLSTIYQHQHMRNLYKIVESYLSVIKAQMEHAITNIKNSASENNQQSK